MNKEIAKLQKIAGILKESHNEPLEIGDSIVVSYGNEYYGYTGKVEDIKRGFIIVSLDDIDGEFSMHSSDVKKIKDLEDDEADSFYDDDDYGSDNPEDGYGTRMYEINEAAFIPDNIEKFAKKKGVLSLVKKVAGWAEKSDKKIVGGTAIGKYYDTLILDLSRNDGAIRINIDDSEVTLYDEPVNSAKSFAKVLETKNKAEKD